MNYYLNHHSSAQDYSFLRSYVYLEKNYKSNYYSKAISYNYTIFNVYQYEILSNLSIKFKVLS